MLSMVSKIAVIALVLCYIQVSAAGCMQDVLTKVEEVVDTPDPTSARSVQLYLEIYTNISKCNETIFSWDHFKPMSFILNKLDSWIRNVINRRYELLNTGISKLKAIICAFIDEKITEFVGNPLNATVNVMNTYFNSYVSDNMKLASSYIDKGYKYIDLDKTYVPKYILDRQALEKKLAEEKKKKEEEEKRKKEEEAKRLAEEAKKLADAQAAAAPKTTPKPSSGGGGGGFLWW